MALHAKAKAEAGYRFYALYDKISREDILAHAWAQCRSNKGAPGVDGQDFADVEAYGVQRWLGELALALRNEEYRPDPIRRVFIPKANSTAKNPKFRPLGISTLRDRVCMTAAMLVLEPIFEADLPPEQYAYRPGRNAQQAVIEVEETLFRGHPEVVDADLADYFGSIPHAELMLSLARRIVDARVLHLVKMWLECTVEETVDRGRKTRPTEAKDQRHGIPQGSPISPLLSNLYLTEVDRMLRRAKAATRYAGRYDAVEYARFADDLVILVDAHPRHAWLRRAVPMRLLQELAKLQVDVNKEKSATVDLDRGESLGFLGYDFRRVRALSGARRPQFTPNLKKRTAVLGEVTRAPPDERGGNRQTGPTATAPHLDSTEASQPGPWIHRPEPVI
jgi:group II intron reverse transcriptase/maturase